MEGLRRASAKKRAENSKHPTAWLNSSIADLTLEAGTGGKSAVPAATSSHLEMLPATGLSAKAPVELGECMPALLTSSVPPLRSGTAPKRPKKQAKAARISKTKQRRRSAAAAPEPTLRPGRGSRRQLIDDEGLMQGITSAGDLGVSEHDFADQLFPIDADLGLIPKVPTSTEATDFFLYMSALNSAPSLPEPLPGLQPETSLNDPVEFDNIVSALSNGFDSDSIM